ncbi:MAG: glycosyltransferase family 4 protein [Planctomycetes bacterium]|nr:glycosyltransferase family 4 protein [Planctomycetota bacterium]
MAAKLTVPTSTTTPLRVAQVMECTIGGTRRHIRELSTGLAGRGVDVTLFASAERDPTFRDDLRAIAATGVRVVELPMVRAITPRLDVSQMLALRSAFRGGRFDVVHTHSSKAGALGRTAALLVSPRPRIVHTPHTFAFNFTAQFSAKKRRLFLSIERGLGRRTDRLVHVSASEREEGLALGIVPQERAVVIENGIDTSAYANGDRARVRAGWGVSDDTFVLGTVGLLNEAKGHADLIDAAARLAPRHPKLRVMIVGEGDLRGPLEQRIERHGLRGVVSLLGYRRDVPDVMSGFDAFCLPSLWEGLPYVVLEAQAAGLATIVTDVNGSRDIVRADVTGLVVPKSDPAALAAAIERLVLDRALRERLASAGRDRVRSHYALARMIDEHVALYTGLVGRSSA